MNQHQQIQLPQEAIRVFMVSSQQISGGNQDSKETKNKKAIAKQEIIGFMQQANMLYINVDDKYLVLKEKFKKPCLNVEFITEVYVDFNEKFHLTMQNVPTRELAVKFAEYVFILQKKTSERHFDLDLCKKKPMTIMLTEAFQTCRSD